LHLHVYFLCKVVRINTIKLPVLFKLGPLAVSPCPCKLLWTYFLIYTVNSRLWFLWNLPILNSLCDSSLGKGRSPEKEWDVSWRMICALCLTFERRACMIHKRLQWGPTLLWLPYHGVVERGGQKNVFTNNLRSWAGCWWLTSVIVATQEAEIKSIVVQSQP
jgi:hypothetical protein